MHAHGLYLHELCPYLRWWWPYSALWDSAWRWGACRDRGRLWQAQRWSIVPRPWTVSQKATEDPAMTTGRQSLSPDIWGTVMRRESKTAGGHKVKWLEIKKTDLCYRKKKLFNCYSCQEERKREERRQKGKGEKRKGGEGSRGKGREGEELTDFNRKLEILIILQFDLEHLLASFCFSLPMIEVIIDELRTSFQFEYVLAFINKYV